MSQENVEVVRHIIESARRGDFEAALSGYDDAVVLDQSRMPDGGVFRGRDGVLAFYTRWFGAWTDLRIEPERYIDAGDAVVVVLQILGKGRDTGADVAMRAADVMTVEGGRVVRQVGYPDAGEALEILGLPD